MRHTFARGLAAVGVVSVALSAAALADPPQPTEMVTVDGQDYPICAVEDCSDQPEQIGVWRSKRTGREFLIIGEATYPITK